MQQSGEYRIGAPIGVVWRALNDPDVLAECIDGCEAMERSGENAFTARVKAKVGPVSAVFNADVTLTDINPPHSYTLNANVKGGPAGFGKGTARVALSEEGGATALRYDVEGSVGGKLAQVGQRLVDGAARKMADDFFAAFGEAVAPGASESAPEAPADPSVKSTNPRWLIGIALAAAVAIILLLFLRH
jgi:carbon monoxide dehydrogenase subunit G